MVKRKLFTALISAILSISTIAILFTFEDTEGFKNFFLIFTIISMYVLPAILLYAIPVTFLAEKITNGMSKLPRILSSFILHASFGAMFVFFIGLLFDTYNLFNDFQLFWYGTQAFFIYGLAISIIFWLIDECLRYFHSNKQAY